LETVFERYCLSACASAFAAEDQRTALVQPLCQVSRSATAAPGLEIRPDLLVARGSRPLLVLDAKWKRLPGSPLLREDVYQVLAYCTALGLEQALLVYPGRRDRAWGYDFVHAPVRLTVRTLRVVGAREALRRSLRRLVRAVRRAT